MPGTRIKPHRGMAHKDRYLGLRVLQHPHQTYHPHLTAGWVGIRYRPLRYCFSTRYFVPGTGNLRNLFLSFDKKTGRFF